MSAAGGFITSDHAFASTAGASTKRKSTAEVISERTSIRVCAKGATVANIAESYASARQGAWGGLSQGAQASTNSGTVIARMYSPLNARSFRTSKKAGDG